MIPATSIFGQATTATAPASSPVTVTALIRQRTNVTQWFAAMPTAEQDGHQDSLLRLGITQRLKHFDYQWK